MQYFGEILYLILLWLAVKFWRKRAGRNLDELISDGGHEHHHVHRVIAQHPKGGTWRQHLAWMTEEDEASISH